MDARTRLQEYILGKDGLSYAKVSKAAGLSDSLVHKYCTGKNRSITIESLEKIAEAMNVSLRWLLFGEGEPEEVSNVTYIFSNISEDDRPLALDILKSMANKERSQKGAA